jgi:D-amino-acid dehydrogenase
MRVLVLGAGIVGVTAAYFLARAGHDVTVVERQQGPALETSYGNAGHLLGETCTPWLSPDVPRMILATFGRRGAPYLIRLRADPAMWLWALRFLRHCSGADVARITATLRRLARYSLATLHTLRDAEAIDYDATQGGMLHLYRDDRSFEAAARHAERDGDVAPPTVLDPAGCAACEPALADTRVPFVGGLHYAQEETGDSRLFAATLAERAVRLGVVFRYRTDVRALRREGQRVTGAATDAGPIDAEATVLSLGSASPLLLHPLGIRVPIYPVKGYSATLSTEGHNRAPSIPVHDQQRKIGITPMGSRLRAAGTAEFDGYNLRMDRRRMASLVDNLMAIFPEAGDPATAECWTGLRPMTPDCTPILGATPYPGLFLNTGHGSLGWTLACGSARVITDLVSGAEPDIDLTGLTLERYR